MCLHVSKCAATRRSPRHGNSEYTTTLEVEFWPSPQGSERENCRREPSRCTACQHSLCCRSPCVSMCRCVSLFVTEGAGSRVCWNSEQGRPGGPASPLSLGHLVPRIRSANHWPWMSDEKRAARPPCSRSSRLRGAYPSFSMCGVSRRPTSGHLQLV